MRKETVTFNSVKYTRLPDSPDRAKRVYFHASRGSKHGTLHRAVWVDAHGDIPKGFHIHHVDENPLNNSIENLQCLSPKDHSRVHPGAAASLRQTDEWKRHLDTIRPLAKKWHASAEGVEWHRQNSKKYWEGAVPPVVKCVVCGKKSQRFMQAKYCSRKCARIVADSEDRYIKTAECPICGQDYKTSKYTNKAAATCSRKCGAVLRKQRAGA